MASKKHPMVGKNVIVRANVAGVHAGTVAEISGDTVILKKARRLWGYYTKDRTGSVSDVALNGLMEGADHSVGAELPSVCIINPQGFELAEMTKKAYESVMSYPVK